MKILEMIDQLREQVNAETITPAAAASCILFELAREEMETNSIYAAAIRFAAECMDEQGAEILANGREIMGDEDNHCTRFKALASACLDIQEPSD